MTAVIPCDLSDRHGRVWVWHEASRRYWRGDDRGGQFRTLASLQRWNGPLTTTGVSR